MPAWIELRRDAGRVDPTHGPWLRRKQLGPVRGAPTPDEPVRIDDRHGVPVAWGLWSEESNIRVRVLSWGAEAPPPDWLERRIDAAIADRDRWCPADTTGLRLINSEGDGLPGLVVDQFGEARVVQLTTAPMAALRPRILAHLARRAEQPTHVVVPAAAARLEGIEERCEVAGDAPLEFREHGLRFRVDPPPAQKTGAYFDQRANRRWVARHVRPGATSVLDLGCHAGGFAIAAAAAGASVVAVDSSEAALAMARRNAELNGIDDVTWVRDDMFGPMSSASLAGPFSIIVADPPKVVARRRDLDAARSGMRNLVANLVPRLSPNGMLLLCSCSHHFGRTELDAAVARAAPDRLVRVSWRGADSDHPVMPGHAEGEYLRIGVYRRRSTRLGSAR